MKIKGECMDCKKVIFISFLLMIVLALSSQNPQMITGYRTNARLPIINEAPNNDGLYYDLYMEASKRMNVELEFIRKPKKRLIKEMQDGILDFYPGFLFPQNAQNMLSFSQTTCLVVLPS